MVSPATPCTSYYSCGVGHVVGLQLGLLNRQLREVLQQVQCCPPLATGTHCGEQRRVVPYILVGYRIKHLLGLVELCGSTAEQTVLSSLDDGWPARVAVAATGPVKRPSAFRRRQVMALASLATLGMRTGRT